MELQPVVQKDLRMMILGQNGVGKSATANMILGIEIFNETETIQCEIQTKTLGGRNVSVIDTPGIHNPSLSTKQWRTEVWKGFLLSSPGPHVFLLVARLGDVSEEDRNAVERMREHFGEEVLKFSMILFIGREAMASRQCTKFFEDDRTKELIRFFEGRYCVINGKRERNTAQIINLLQKIEAMVNQNGDQFYTQEMFEEVGRKSKTLEEGQKKDTIKTGHETIPGPNQDPDLEEENAVIGVNVKCANMVLPKKEEESLGPHPEKKEEMETTFVKEDFRFQEETEAEKERKECEEVVEDLWVLLPDLAMERERRIVLLGKTGSGKSSTGNTILKGTYFKVKSSPELVTKVCDVQEAGCIKVIDTPGMFDTLLTLDQLKSTIKDCANLSLPGPHAFLLVIRLGRFTEEENTVRWIQEIFGEEASDYIIVLFTHADQLGDRTLEEFIAESTELTRLLNSCGNRYHAFNNNDSDPTQVGILMRKINNMVVKNKGRFHTHEMYKKVQRHNIGEMIGAVAVLGAAIACGVAIALINK